MPGIAELAHTQPKGIPIDDVLEGLAPEVRDVLLTALKLRNPLNRREFMFSTPHIMERCAEDGFQVTEWSIKTWRRKHADR